MNLPYDWANPVLAIASTLCFFLAVTLAIVACFRQGRRRKPLAAALASFLLAVLFGAAIYALIFWVQLPHFARHQIKQQEQRRSEASLVHVGDVAPPFQVQTIDGQQFSLEALRGKVVLLNFFATWCGPCIGELPHIESMWQSHSQSPHFALLVIGREESAEIVKAFRAKMDFTFPMAADADRRIYSRYAKELIPRSYLIGRDGVVCFSACGNEERNLAELKAAVAEELARNGNAAAPKKIAAIDTSGFGDSAHHWRRIRDPKRVIQPLPDQPAYSSEQVSEIAANILLFQRSNGGWPKDYDMRAILTDDQRRAILATRDAKDTSFDNHNTHAQVEYLARAYSAGKEPAWREACLRGLDFMLATQMAKGGFPQRAPRAKGYAAHITFNDGVMIGILDVLKDIADGRPEWSWIAPAYRSRASEAVRRGVECILKCQIHVDGRLTGWCQQHDEKTFTAASARTFELASICPQDTTNIVEFLMRVEKPEQRIINAIDAAVAWLREAQLRGVRIQRIAAPAAEFERHTADFDVVIVVDPKSPPIWARHYEIGTNKPIFAGRDGIKRYALNEIERERRTGTPWYGGWPQSLLDERYPKWKAAHP